jgi:predicted RNA binding protein YcfA (HicA-like mRNA interferase family)
LPKKYPPLKPQEVIDILTTRGFVLNNQEGSHRQYVGFFNGKRCKVTVDMSMTDYSDDLTKSMIRQSGMNRDEFYCSTKGTARKIGKKLIL